MSVQMNSPGSVLYHCIHVCSTLFHVDFLHSIYPSCTDEMDKSLYIDTGIKLRLPRHCTWFKVLKSWRALLKPVCTVNTLEVWTAWNILAFVGSYPKVSAIWTNWLHHWEAKGSNVFASSWCSGTINSLDILCKRTHTSPIIVSSATIINYPEIDQEVPLDMINLVPTMSLGTRLCFGVVEKQQKVCTDWVKECHELLNSVN